MGCCWHASSTNNNGTHRGAVLDRFITPPSSGAFTPSTPK
jgi:hypothetical protein